MNLLMLALTWAVALWLIRRDTARREGVSRAVWIPTLWVGILASRPLSSWLGVGGAEDTLEGSPVDRLFYFGLIALSVVVLARRRVDWGAFIGRNWPLLLFYGYLLVSVLWANQPATSLKRWIKEYGNILVALVLLTELDPGAAIRAVFVRCAYVLIPLSVVYIRYFPAIGRRYGVHSGAMEVTGVTTQKNSLGAMVLVCALVLIWEWFERGRRSPASTSRVEQYAILALLGIGAWLLDQCDSKTSLVCLGLATLILASLRLPLLRRRVSALGGYALLGAIGFAAVDHFVGLTARVVRSLGRDLTFTGRTDVWHELLQVRTDPWFGTGFMSFWDDLHYRAQLPKWVAYSAHDGYLEIYLAGGFIGVALLVLLLLVTGLRINAALLQEKRDAVVRFAIFVVALIANISESNFACMTPVGFLFLLAALAEVPSVHAFAPAASGWRNYDVNGVSPVAGASP